MVLVKSFKKYSNLVALPHSVFALPFALASLILAANRGTLVKPLPIYLTLTLVVVAVISARTAALSFNRLIDADIDKLNPRTNEREIPSGRLQKSSVLFLTIISSLLYFTVVALLGKHCAILSPFVLLILLGYSFAKRFTSFAHLILGLSLALAPGGAWWVLRPQIEITPIFMMLAVMTWVAGFDILYSCQDAEFDKNANLYSIPSKIGIALAFKLTRILHFFSILFFLLVGLSTSLGITYYYGMSMIALLMLIEHLLISPKKLSRINHAFFTCNGLISIIYFLTVILSGI